MIEQVKVAAAIHEDSREVESVNDWVKDQCGRTSVAVTGRMVSAIESDRIG